MTSAAVEVPPRRRVWDVVAEHVEQRAVSLGSSAPLAAADMRARAAFSSAERHLVEGDHLAQAYQKSLDFIGLLAMELEAYGAPLDEPIDVRAPASSRLVRVQALLWDHVRTVVQVRNLIEERAA